MSWKDRLTNVFSRFKPTPPPPKSPKQVIDEAIGVATNMAHGKRKLPKQLDNIKSRKIKGDDGLEVRLEGDMHDPEHPLIIEKEGKIDPNDKIDTSEKLTTEQRLRVCEWIAQFKNEGDIQSLVKEYFDIKMSRQNIHQYLKSSKWKSIIDKFRHEYVTQTMDIPIMHKKVRLERLEELYQKTMVDPNIMGLDRRTQALAVLQAAMREVDERASNFTTIYANQIINLDDEALLKRKQQLLDKVKTIDITPKTADAKKVIDYGIDKEASSVQ